MRLLDLYCCEGGSATGYANAGFDVVGVDIAPQRRYPFEFHQGDAIDYLLEHGREFDAIHASPPCQAYSITKHSHSKEHPDLLEPTRRALQQIGKPYIIENVEGAPLIDPLLLCGTMFGLRAVDVDGVPLALQRHRLFESNVWLMSAGGCAHDHTQVAGVYGGSRHTKPEDRDNPGRRGGYTPATSIRADLMGMPWASQYGLSQAIPPAYTEFLGGQLMRHLTSAVAA